MGIFNFQLKPNCLLTRHPITFYQLPRSLRVPGTLWPWNGLPRYLRSHGYDIRVISKPAAIEKFLVGKRAGGKKSVGKETARKSEVVEIGKVGEVGKDSTAPSVDTSERLPTEFSKKLSEKYSAGGLTQKELAQTEFAQTEVGQTEFAQTEFGQTKFGQRRLPSELFSLGKTHFVAPGKLREELLEKVLGKVFPWDSLASITWVDPVSSTEMIPRGTFLNCTLLTNFPQRVAKSLGPHELFLQHCIFLAEYDLTTAK